ncbi:MAG: hypothetical protein K2X97_18510 [Mycobacteriaceae bacterium]|nr:hypothetical protein [Mycobacteriaceae bacterium]
MGERDGAAWRLLWTLRWPTRREAMGFAVLSSASIGLAALAQNDPLAAMSRARSGRRWPDTSVFHGPPLMLYNFAIAALTGAVEATRISVGSGVVSALCAYTVILTLSLVGAVRHPSGCPGARRRRHSSRT